MGKVGKRVLALVVGLSVAALHSGTGRAEGALAIAQPPDVVKDGFSYGTAYRYDDSSEASSAALKRCRETKSEKLRKLCKVVVPFTGKCVAVAMDPKFGTPGIGWAVEDTEDAAGDKAMAECRAVGGNRARFCELSDVGCDF